jgi:hypothetical protein
MCMKQFHFKNLNILICLSKYNLKRRKFGLCIFAFYAFEFTRVKYHANFSHHMAFSICRPLSVFLCVFTFWCSAKQPLVQIQYDIPWMVLFQIFSCDLVLTPRWPQRLLIVWNIRNLQSFSSEPVDGMNLYQIVCAWSLSQILPVDLVNSLDTAADPVVLGFLALS